MAQRRMFSKQIVNTDAFLDMPVSAQLLYFHLNMEADDDGFVSSPKKIMKILGSSSDDFKILEAKRFILVFESGVIVIKHWLIHNYIRKDTYSETKYEQEKNSLTIKENGSYTERQLSVDDTLTQDRLGKDRLGKDILGAEPLEVNQLLDFFKKTVNEHISFGNKTERKACKDLIEKYGLQKTKEALLYLEEKRKTDKYLPLITTPYELWTKWAKIKQHLTVKKRKIWKPTSLSLPSLPEENIK